MIMASRTILICEDNRSLLDLLVFSLEDLGYQVRAYASATKACQDRSIDLGSFDVVVTDFAMPGMDGEELARIVLDLNPKARIVIISGTYHLNVDQSDLNLDVLVKPFTPDELLRRIGHDSFLPSAA